MNPAEPIQALESLLLDRVRDGWIKPSELAHFAIGAIAANQIPGLLTRDQAMAMVSAAVEVVTAKLNAWCQPKTITTFEWNGEGYTVQPQQGKHGSVRFYEDKIDELLAKLAEAERERDLAIAHDRQPYPTAAAYEAACAALEISKGQCQEAIGLSHQHRNERDAALAKLKLHAGDTLSLQNEIDNITQRLDEADMEWEKASAERDAAMADGVTMAEHHREVCRELESALAKLSEAETKANHLRCDLADETNAAQVVKRERDEMRKALWELMMECQVFGIDNERRNQIAALLATTKETT